MTLHTYLKSSTKVIPTCTNKLPINHVTETSETRESEIELLCCCRIVYGLLLF